jgi:alpha-ketoglutarate-dependent taurine dioxygenase
MQSTHPISSDQPSVVGTASELEEALRRESVGIIRLGASDIAGRLQELVSRLGVPVNHKHADKATHLVDIRANGSYDATRRPQSTPDRQSPHTDGAFLAQPPAIVSLCSVATAERGGESLVVHGAKLLQEALTAMSAEDLSVLFRPDCYRVHRGPQSVERPVLSLSPDSSRLLISFGSHEFNRVDVTPAADQAFQLIDRLRMRRDLQQRFLLAPGDAIFLSNFAVLHGREGWIDGSERKRHLLRVWIAPEPNSALGRMGLDPTGSGVALSELVRHGSQRLAEREGAAE